MATVKKTNKIPTPMGTGTSDIFYTPPVLLDPILPFIPKDWILWECACGIGNLTNAMIAKGYKVKWSDISRDPMEDFLKWTPKSFDAIVTNPPFSFKDKFIERAYALKKPWAFLLPVTATSAKFRQSLYREHGVQFTYLGGRTNFMADKNAPWFETMWISWKLKLPSPLNFYDFEAGVLTSMTMEGTSIQTKNGVLYASS